MFVGRCLSHVFWTVLYRSAVDALSIHPPRLNLTRLSNYLTTVSLKVPLWCKLHFSHSNPRAAWCYLSQEERCATPLAHYYPYATTVTDPLKAHRYNASLPLRCAMRLKLSGSKGGSSAAALEAAAEESFGSRRRPGPLAGWTLGRAGCPEASTRPPPCRRAPRR